ncbi:hypothetical protein ACE193_22335 [Bernardetia sp. OM2101]|uniref:hypothetical protein n=1 Tax=Bernardetia sp. OM2101 TaxID=3344876 RepID=UPI0035CFB3F3
MTTHTLQKEKHQDFLKQERIDPITGDILQEGDDIVICASCKSAFLVDSWLYMDGKHCNQIHTLREIPKQEAVKIDRESRNERLDKLTFYKFNLVKPSEVTGVYVGIFALLGGVFELLSYFSTIIDISFGGWIALGIVGFGIGKKITKNKSLHLDSGHFVLNHGLNNQTSISTQEIQNIDYKKAGLFSKIVNSPIFNKEEDFYNLIITTTNQKKHKFFIAERELNRILKETNIFTKYNALGNNQIPFQNTTHIYPPNDRLDLGSPS